MLYPAVVLLSASCLPVLERFIFPLTLLLHVPARFLHVLACFLHVLMPRYLVALLDFTPNGGGGNLLASNLLASTLCITFLPWPFVLGLFGVGGPLTAGATLGRSCAPYLRHHLVDNRPHHFLADLGSIAFCRGCSVSLDYGS